MNQYRLGLRMISSETGTNLYELSRGQVKDYSQIQNISSGLKNIFIDFDVNLSCHEIISRIRQFSETKSIEFIVLDYLQKLKFSKKERHDLAVAEATGTFKNAAKEFNVPFVLLSQLSRSNEKEGKAVRMPRLSDLRDSGSIEQDADIVTFIHRQEVYEPDKEKLKNLAELLIAKNRDGDIGKIKLTFRKEINRFENYTDEYF
jgi:replicative DNA helicase